MVDPKDSRDKKQELFITSLGKKFDAMQAKLETLIPKVDFKKYLYRARVCPCTAVGCPFVLRGKGLLQCPFMHSWKALKNLKNKKDPLSKQALECLTVWDGDESSIPKIPAR